MNLRRSIPFAAALGACVVGCNDTRPLLEGEDPGQPDAGTGGPGQPAPGGAAAPGFGEGADAGPVPSDVAPIDPVDESPAGQLRAAFLAYCERLEGCYAELGAEPREDICAYYAEYAEYVIREYGNRCLRAWAAYYQCIADEGYCVVERGRGGYYAFLEYGRDCYAEYEDYYRACD